MVDFVVLLDMFPLQTALGEQSEGERELICSTADSAIKHTRSKTEPNSWFMSCPRSEDRSPQTHCGQKERTPMRPDIKFESPHREAQKNSVHPVFTFCSRLFTFVHDKKISRENFHPREPEKIGALPEDEQLKPEREPEYSASRKNSVLNLSHVPSPAISTSSAIDRSKPSAISTVPLCSALFRQKFSHVATQTVWGGSPDLRPD